MSDTIIKNHAAFIWSVADLLRGDYKQSEYGKVILPLAVLRRLDCVLEPTKAKVLEKAAKLRGIFRRLPMGVIEETARGRCSRRLCALQNARKPGCPP